MTLPFFFSDSMILSEIWEKANSKVSAVRQNDCG